MEIFFFFSSVDKYRGDRKRMEIIQNYNWEAVLEDVSLGDL